MLNYQRVLFLAFRFLAVAIFREFPQISPQTTHEGRSWVSTASLCGVNIPRPSVSSGFSQISQNLYQKMSTSTGIFWKKRHWLDDRDPSLVLYPTTQPGSSVRVATDPQPSQACNTTPSVFHASQLQLSENCHGPKVHVTGFTTRVITIVYHHK